MGTPVILSACRTAGGKFCGSLEGFSAHELGGFVIAEAVKRSGVQNEDIREGVLGNAWQANVGMNPARIAMVNAGLPVDVPAFSVNQRCGTGLQTVMIPADRIRLGSVTAGVAGGMESASNVPYFLEGARKGFRMGERRVVDGLHKDGFLCPFTGMLMGETGDVLARELSISRREQDEYAAESHRKAVAAAASGKFRAEIVPITLREKKAERIFDRDEIPREDTSVEKLSALPPVFGKDGTISAGNSSGLCDAASALVVADGEWAEANGHRPLAKIRGYATVALAPLYMGLGPVFAVPKALAAAKLSFGDIDLVELNEAFAAQVLAVHRKMPFDMERCNIYGGVIALGHPSGATGAKILATLVHALATEDKQFGLVTLCVGGGQGVAMAVERMR